MKTNTGWQYRLVSSLGAGMLVVLSVVMANQPLAQRALTTLPILSLLKPTILTNGTFTLAVLTTLPVMVVSLAVLFKPRPRRILDTISLTLRRVFAGFLALAAIGYFDYTYRLPRTTLLLTTFFLCIFLPAWFVLIRRRPATTEQAVLVGDDPETMNEILTTNDQPIIGYITPEIQSSGRPNHESSEIRFADGGIHTHAQLDEIECLGGLSRLDDLLEEHDIDTAILAFERSDRAEFFGALATCYSSGVTAKVHRKHADSVLTSEKSAGDLIDTDLEPWDAQDRTIKRLFDVAFAAIALIALIPVIFVISVAIKLDDGGPLFYGQERTAEFGKTFHIYKFRSMIPDAEAKTGAKLSEEDDGGVDARVTRVGRILRKTHLDEIPQLWSILVGSMSVVGPRPERPELDNDIEKSLLEWRRRWFVKPGLTGLAQINEVTGYEPKRKLRFDMRYIQEQSFWVDLQIVVRQVWLVLTDMLEMIRSQ